MIFWILAAIFLLVLFAYAWAEYRERRIGELMREAYRVDDHQIGVFERLPLHDWSEAGEL